MWTGSLAQRHQNHHDERACKECAQQMKSINNQAGQLGPPGRHRICTLRSTLQANCKQLFPSLIKTTKSCLHVLTYGKFGMAKAGRLGVHHSSAGCSLLQGGSYVWENSFHKEPGSRRCVMHLLVGQCFNHIICLGESIPQGTWFKASNPTDSFCAFKIK